MRLLACGCVLACRVEPSGDSRSQHNRKPAGAALIAGEASSNTFTSANGIYLRGFRGATPFAEWAGAAGTNATLPALLREAQPYLRLILKLRDPVTRYYSAFHYYRWWLKEERPPTPDDFHETALKEVQEWKDCVAARSVPDCVRSFKPQQLVKGMYAQFLPVSGGVFITECWLHGVPVGALHAQGRSGVGEGAGAGRVCKLLLCFCGACRVTGLAAPLAAAAAAGPALRGLHRRAPAAPQGSAGLPGCPRAGRFWDPPGHDGRSSAEQQNLRTHEARHTGPAGGVLRTLQRSACRSAWRQRCTLEVGRHACSGRVRKGERGFDPTRFRLAFESLLLTSGCSLHPIYPGQRRLCRCFTRRRTHRFRQLQPNDSRVASSLLLSSPVAPSAGPAAGVLAILTVSGLSPAGWLKKQQLAAHTLINCCCCCRRTPRSRLSAANMCDVDADFEALLNDSGMVSPATAAAAN